MRTILLLLLLVGIVPAHAANAGVPLIAAAATAEAADDGSDPEVQAFFDEFYGGNYKGALTAASKLKSQNGEEGRGMISAMRGAAMVGLKRRDEARKLFAEAERLAPMTSNISMLQFEAGLFAEDSEIAAAGLDRLIAKFPDDVRSIEPRFMNYFLRDEPKDQKARNDDRRIALARLGFGEPDSDYLAAGAIRILVDRGDVAGASDLLHFVDDPASVEDLLIQKRFAALWPKIQSMAGPHLEKVRASSVSAAERSYAENPSDFEKLTQLIDALRHAGRYEDAIALRARLPATKEAMAASADENVGWALNNIALALEEVGRSEEADQLFALLNEAPMKDAGWRVSMIINRLEMLVGNGKFEKAAALVDSTEQVASKDGNEYAQQLVRRLRYCIASRLGKKEEAAKLLPGVLEHAKDAYGATVDGLVCGGQIAKAEEVTLAALKDDEDFGGNLVRQLQPITLTSDDPSFWADGWRELHNRPAIAKEYERLGRDMPADFVPPPVPKLS